MQSFDKIILREKMLEIKLDFKDKENDRIKTMLNIKVKIPER